MIRRTALVVAAVLGVFAVARGIVELATVHYTDPSSYAKDWGGPSLAGVLAVHTGLAVLAIGAAIVWWRRRSKGSSS